MQIGDPEMDVIFDKIIYPSLKSCGLEPRRVDKHEEGDLLKSEIVEFIKSSEIVIAELTNERPNCYLEVGIAMGLNKAVGLNKNKNIVLVAREDHNPDRPGRKVDEPKVHFDLQGYSILYWDPNDLEDFADRLIKTVNRRLKTLSEKTSDESIVDAIEKEIKNNDRVGFNKNVREIKKILIKNWKRLYNKYLEIYLETNDPKEHDKISLACLEEFEKLTNVITYIGLLLIENNAVDFYKFIEEILVSIFEFPEIILRPLYGTKYTKYLQLLYVPVASLQNTYYYWGALSILKKDFAALKVLLNINVRINDLTLSKTEIRPIWAIFHGDDLATFNRNYSESFEYLKNAYEYSKNLQTFFDDKSDLEKYVYQFNLILCLNSIEKYGKLKLGSYCSELGRLNMRLFVEPLLSIIKNDKEFRYSLSEILGDLVTNSDGKETDKFIKEFPKRCGIINASASRSYDRDHIPCDYFVS